jgi:hypothetical protein
MMLHACEHEADADYGLCAQVNQSVTHLKELLAVAKVKWASSPEHRLRTKNLFVRAAPPQSGELLFFVFDMKHTAVTSCDFGHTPLLSVSICLYLLMTLFFPS